MPILTLEAIRANPWSAVHHDLPPKPDRLLLKAALLAVGYCRSSEFGFTVAAREGRYASPQWKKEPDDLEAHDDVQDRWIIASLRYMHLLVMHRAKFGEPFTAYSEALF